MAVFRNVMAFLGLDDDDQMYDDEAYYDEEEVEPVPVATAQRNPKRTIALDERLAEPEPSFGFSADSAVNEMGGVGAVRPLRPVPSAAEEVPNALAANERRTNLPDTAGAFEAPPEIVHTNPVVEDAVPDPAPVSDTPDDAPRPSLTAIDGNGGSAAPARSTIRNTVEETQSDVVTYAKPRLHIPSSFDDASRIADDFRIGSPVVMNLTKVDKSIARRLIDFASGVCYVLEGGMERVAPNVYLLTPSGIDVSGDDRRRMQERGYDR